MLLINVVKKYLYDCYIDYCAEPYKDNYDYSHNILVSVAHDWLINHDYDEYNLHYPYLVWISLRGLLLKKFKDVPNNKDVVHAMLKYPITAMLACKHYKDDDSNDSNDSNEVDLLKYAVKGKMWLNTGYTYNLIPEIINVAKELLIDFNNKFDNNFNIDDIPADISGDLNDFIIKSNETPQELFERLKHALESYKSTHVWNSLSIDPYNYDFVDIIGCVVSVRSCYHKYVYKSLQTLAEDVNIKLTRDNADDNVVRCAYYIKYYCDMFGVDISIVYSFADMINL